MKFLRGMMKDIRTFERGLKICGETRGGRRMRKKVRRWAILGSEIFHCDSDWLYRMWGVTLNTPTTLEEIVEMAEYLGELGQVGINSRKAGESLRRVINDLGES